MEVDGILQLGTDGKAEALLRDLGSRATQASDGLVIPPSAGTQAASTHGASGGSASFDAILGGLEAAEQKEIEAGRLMEAFAKGEDVPVHELMAATHEASLALETLVALRSHVLDAFHEVMRTQV